VTTVESGEHKLLQDTATGILASGSTSAIVRAAMATGTIDSALWRSLVDTGLVGLGIPEEFGGGGGGGVELGLVLEEMGRFLAPVPYYESTALAAPLLLATGSAADKDDLLPRLAGGLKVSVALVDAGGGWSPDSVQTTYSAVEGGYRVSGDKVLVPRGRDAEALMVVARREGIAGSEGVAVLWVDAHADGVDISPMSPMDPTWPQARVGFRGATARLLGDGGGGFEGVRLALAQSTALLAAQMAGGAKACLDMAIRYSLDRHQFGRPIGSFQAVKHRAADMLFDADTCRAIARFATRAVSDDAARSELVASHAKAWCSDAFFRCAAGNLHIHGGIGFTWEHDCQLYYKRALASAAFLGDARHHRDRLAAAIGLVS
jgi:alkylation response protein AidB-like acyl-CoA dehydrogenase